MNIGVMLIIGIALSCLNLSYFYDTPSLFALAIMLTLAFSYLFISLFYARNIKLQSGVKSGAWKKLALISAIGFSIEFYLGGVPILVGREVAVTLPVLHVVFYSCAIVSVLFASIYGTKNEMILALLYAFVISALMLSRQMMIVAFFIALISISSKIKFTRTMNIKLIATILFVIVIFGMLGNLRQQLSGDYVNDYIQEIGGANDNGLMIGDSLYWVWLYIASPIYNLVLNINSYYEYGDMCNKLVVYGTCDANYVLSVLVPDTFSKHFMDQFYVDMVMGHLNAGTAFSAPVRLLGLTGLCIQFILQIIFYAAGLMLTNEKNRTAFIVYFSALSLFMIFDNLYIRGEFFFGFILIFICGFKFKFLSKRLIANE